MLHFLSKAIILFSIIYVNCEKKIYIIPQDLVDCDPNIRVLDSEYGEVKQIGPHHVAIDVPHFVLKQTVSEPTKVKVVIDKHKGGDKWNFFVKKEFPGACGLIQLDGFPWSYAVSQFGPGQLVCPIRPLDVPLHNITFDGDVSQFFDLSEADIGLYRLTITGTGQIGLKNEPLGCMTAKFKIEAFDE